jgi:hypothetical protein
MLFVLTSVYMQFGLGLAAENAKYSPAVPGEHPKVSVADDYLIGLGCGEVTSPEQGLCLVPPTRSGYPFPANRPQLAAHVVISPFPLRLFTSTTAW